MFVITASKLRDICKEIFLSIGVNEEDAGIVTDTIVKAELRGVESHGVIRLPAYVNRIEGNLINLNPDIKVVGKDTSFLLIDADNGLGQVVAVKAIDLAVERAKETGCCVVSTYNTNYLGMLAYYAIRIAQKNMIGLVMCNTPPFVAPTGGMEAMIGTNPICYGIPTGKEYPLVLDMAIAPAVGKIRVALQKGNKIPEGWAIDKNGQPTTDPKAALEGTILPIGGPKGYGLGLVVDILAGVLSGANYGTKIPHPLFDMDNIPNLGNFILVMNIENSMSVENFKNRINELIDEIKRSKKLPGVSEIYVPGEIEFKTEQKRLKEGIPINEKNFQQLQELANKFNIKL